MKLACFENVDLLRPRLAGVAPDPGPDYYPVPLTPELDLERDDYTLICITPNSRINRAVLERLDRLELIVTTSTGFDHIDPLACQERGVRVANVPLWAEHAVAEHVFALLLALARRLEPAVSRVRKGDLGLAGLEGFELFGRTLGVIGTGTIGREVIRIARGFGMEVLGFDLRPEPNQAGRLGFRYVGLEDLLTGSEVVTLHLPAGPETHHLIGRKEIGMMRPGAVIINTSRGENLDTAALLEGLEKGRLAGAGLDVWEELEGVGLAPGQEREKDPLTARLLGREEVILTPHSAWFTTEAKERVFDSAAETIKAFVRGEYLNPVDFPGPV